MFVIVEENDRFAKCDFCGNAIKPKEQHWADEPQDLPPDAPPERVENNSMRMCHSCYEQMIEEAGEPMDPDEPASNEIQQMEEEFQKYMEEGNYGIIGKKPQLELAVDNTKRKGD